MGRINSGNRGGVGAPAAKAATVASAGTGVLYTVTRLLGSSSTLALLSGSASNLTLNAATGAISATGAIGAGASQTAKIRESSGALAVEYPVTLTGAAAAPGTTPPDAPGLAIAAGNAQNTLTITDGSAGSSAIAAHKIYRGQAAGGETLLGTLPIASGLSYIDNQLTNGTTYYYRVSAVNAAGESALSNEASGKPVNTAGLTANQQLLAKLPARPLVGELGGSRERQNGDTAPPQVRSLPSGQLTWAWLKNPRLFRTQWGYSTGVDANSNSMNGMLFALDGQGAWNQYQRVPAVAASDVDVVIVAMSSNTVQFDDFDIYQNDLGTSFSAANYVSLHQQICLALINAGKAVIFKELWERGVYLSDGTTQTGGVWVSGSQPRSQINAINSTMKTWCQAQGIPFLEVRSTMTTSQVNGANTDIVPVREYVRTDSTHLSSKGGQVMGDLYAALFATLFTPGPDFDETAAGNLVTNPTMTGTGGNVTAGYAAGSVLPDGYGATLYGSATGAVTLTKEVRNGRTGIAVTVDKSLVPAGQRVSTRISATVGALTASNYYSARARVDVGTAAELYGTPNIYAYAGTYSTWGMIPIDGGGSGVTDQTSTAPENVPTTGAPSTSGKAPYAAYGGILEAMPVQATQANGGFWIYTPQVGNGSGTVTFWIAAPEFRQVPNPALLMYNEADTAPPALTSPTSYSTPENSQFSTQVVTSKPARLSLSGADAALFSIKASGLLKMSATPDYEAPGDADANNVYDLNLVMTPFNPNVAAVTTPIPVTVTDVADGTVYRFTGADGTDIATLYPGVTRNGGVAGAISVNANTARNSSTSNALTGYAFPQEGDTVDQEVRWRAVTSSSAVQVCVRYVDQNNCILLTVSSGAIAVRRYIGGSLGQIMTIATTGVTSTTATGPGLYKAIAANDNFIAQIINGTLSVFQNLVFVGSVSVAGMFDGTGNLGSGGTPLPATKITGLISNTASGSTNAIDDFNPRPAVAFRPKVALKALALTDQVKAAATAYAGTLANYTGTPSLAVTVDASGLFYADGFNLRSNAPLGASGTSYSVTVTETNDYSVNTPKTTTFTITVP